MDHEPDATNDHSRLGGELQGPSKDEDSLSKEDAATSASRKPRLYPHEESIAEAIGEEEALRIIETLELHQEFSGPIAPPVIWNDYDERGKDILENIANRKTKAMFDDESLRQNALVDAEIAEGKRGQYLSAVIFLAGIVGAVVIEVCTQNAILAGILAGMPFAAVVAKLFKPTKSKSSASPSPRKTEGQ